MKRLPILLLLLLAALRVTLTASAADSAVNRVTLGDGAVTVNVTAAADCVLSVAVYGADGRLLDAQTRDVGATTGADIVITIAGGIPAGSAAKAFLTGADSKPLCKAVSASGGASGDDPAPATDSDVYAILYADGTLVFQYGDTPQAGREVRETYAVDMEKSYDEGEIPWHEMRRFISQVDFADAIQPTSTRYWFYECTKLQEIRNIKNLDTSNVISMFYMFGGCTALTTLDLSGFNTANVTNMSSMFSFCRALTTLDLSGFNTVNVTTMEEMFSGCSALATLDLSGFNTANVTDMSGMFGGCTALTTLDLSAFNTSNVTDMGGMFNYCSALTTLNVSSFNTANVTDMASMFCDCSALTALDVSGFNTSNVAYMSCMFFRCSSLTTLDLSAFNTANVTDMREMFCYCHGLITIYASGYFVTGQVTGSNGNEMFNYCFFLVGGNGTAYDRERVGVKYAHIDGGASAPGYFTAK